MIELPEAIVISNQLRETISGKKIADVIAAHSPHKFAWYSGDPLEYKGLLVGKEITGSAAYGSWVEFRADGMALAFSDGINLRFHGQNEKRPQTHQLLIEFDDLTAISASVQMYGGLLCFRENECSNEYYLQAREKLPVLSVEFDRLYFDGLISKPDAAALSAKALLATGQRIPGIGNGVLQDILFNAGIHPKRKVNTFAGDDIEVLYNSIKSTLAEMALNGGRDTEKDLFGNPGGYRTKASKLTVGTPCDKCGRLITKEAYMGGSIYFCSKCQKL